jgi:hypothetical protein
VELSQVLPTLLHQPADTVYLLKVIRGEEQRTIRIPALSPA